MAQDTESLIKGNISTVKELRNEISALKDSLVTAQEGTQAWTDTVQKLQAAQEKLNSVNNATKQSVDAAADSIVGMERQYKSLYDTYKLLSEEQRESDFGKQMGEQLEELSEKINESKIAVGNYKNNIGHYAQGVIDGFSNMAAGAKAMNNPLKLAKNGFKSLNDSMKVVSTNPVGAIMTVLVQVISQVINAFKENTELQNGLTSAMQAFKPVGEAIQGVFEGIATIVVKCAEGVAAFIGLFSKEVAGAREAAKAEAELNKERKDMPSVETQQKIIGMIKDEADLCTTTEEKIQKLNRAKKVQEQVNQRLIAAAKQEVDALKTRNGALVEGTKANKKYMEAQIKLTETTIAAKKAIKEFDDEIKDITKSSADSWTSQVKAANDSMESIISTYRTSVAASQNNLLGEEKKNYDKQVAELNKNLKKKLISQKSYNTTLEALTATYEKKCTDIRVAAYAEEQAILKEQNELRQQLIPVPSLKDYKNKYEAAENQYSEFLQDIANIGGEFDSENNMFKSIYPDIIDKEGNLSEALQKINIKYDVHLHSLEDINNFYNILQERLTKVSHSYYEYAQTVNRANTELRESVYKVGILDEEEKYYKKVAEIRNDDTLKEKEKNEEIAKLAGERVKRQLEHERLYNERIMEFFEEEKNERHRYNVLELENFEERYHQEVSVMESAHNEEMKALYKSHVKQLKSFKGTEEEKKKLLEQFEGERQVMQDAYQKESKQKFETYMRDRVSLLESQNAQNIAAEKEYYDYKAELRQKDLDAEIAVSERMAELNESNSESKKELFATLTGGINSSISAISSLIQSEIQEGNLTQKQVNKKKKLMKTLEAVTLAASVAQIAADTATGIMGVWSGYGKEQVVNAETAAATGPAAAATLAALNAKSLASAWAKTTTIGVAGAANLAAAIAGSIANFKSINSLGTDSSGASTTSAIGTSAIATPTVADTTPYSYARTLQTAEEEEQMNRPYYVSVTDINDVQNRVKVRESNSTF